ncbi:hypothetical protein [Bifidobacterium callitrichos]|nr:hypothetical protein [Bifidobacterium callitrichos]
MLVTQVLRADAPRVTGAGAAVGAAVSRASLWMPGMSSSMGKEIRK